MNKNKSKLKLTFKQKILHQLEKEQKRMIKHGYKQMWIDGYTEAIDQVREMNL